MPPNQDPEFDPTTESTYECLDCGATIDGVHAPSCPECGASLRNRSFPVE